MKKSLSIMLGLILLASLLVACGGETQEQPTEESETEEGNEARMVEDDQGEVEVPSNPERVVSQYYVGHLLTLGVEPIGTLPTELDNPYIQNQIDGIENIGDPVDVETVIELDPDLIIASDQQSYEQLEKIAPTVLIEYGAHHVIEEMELLGEVLGEQQQATDWIEQFEEKGQQAKQQLDGIVAEDETVSIIEIWANQIYVYGNKWGRGGYNLYNVLELTPPDMVQENLIDDQPYLEVSLESLPDVAGDHIFLSVYGDDGGAERAQEIRNSDVWQSLDAVKNNNVYEINIDDFFYFDPIALEEQLDVQVDLLLGK
ncbi:ABC transporter substrate-binding protein [Aquibacillus sediminis]|uniref:ABC transporter substrate-binding protein n=1 Tax=Aquibacillus sediminis TaxID=2574734 RepID=UPI0011081BD2|nr:ABC transporter substrate-binding protein [Aquibacillus sediminis]